MVFGHNRNGIQLDLDTKSFGHNGIWTQEKWDTVVSGHNETGMRLYLDATRLGHNGIWT